MILGIQENQPSGRRRGFRTTSGSKLCVGDVCVFGRRERRARAGGAACAGSARARACPPCQRHHESSHRLGMKKRRVVGRTRSTLNTSSATRHIAPLMSSDVSSEKPVMAMLACWGSRAGLGLERGVWWSSARAPRRSGAGGEQAANARKRAAAGMGDGGVCVLCALGFSAARVHARRAGAFAGA